MKKIAAVIITLFISTTFYLLKPQDVANEQGKNAVREAVLKAAVYCYAVEGMYPRDISYLEDKYGLVVNRNKYKIDYDLFATNILPDVYVITG